MVRENMIGYFLRVDDTIRTCNTKEQVDCCENFIDNYLSRYRDVDGCFITVKILRARLCDKLEELHANVR